MTQRHGREFLVFKLDSDYIDPNPAAFAFVATRYSSCERSQLTLFGSRHT